MPDREPRYPFRCCKCNRFTAQEFGTAGGDEIDPNGEMCDSCWGVLSRKAAERAKYPIDKDQLHVLQHSLGVDEFGQGMPYRDYFVTSGGSKDHKICESLVAMGLMTNCGTKTFLQGDVFRVTGEGMKACSVMSPEPPRKTAAQRRYSKYRAARDALGVSFGEYLKQRLYECH